MTEEFLIISVYRRFSLGTALKRKLLSQSPIRAHFIRRVNFSYISSFLDPSLKLTLKNWKKWAHQLDSQPTRDLSRQLWIVGERNRSCLLQRPFKNDFDRSNESDEWTPRKLIAIRLSDSFSEAAPLRRIAEIGAAIWNSMKSSDRQMTRKEGKEGIFLPSTSLSIRGIMVNYREIFLTY